MVHTQLLPRALVRWPQSKPCSLFSRVAASPSRAAPSGVASSRSLSQAASSGVAQSRGIPADPLIDGPSLSRDDKYAPTAQLRAEFVLANHTPDAHEGVVIRHCQSLMMTQRLLNGRVAGAGWRGMHGPGESHLGTPWYRRVVTLVRWSRPKGAGIPPLRLGSAASKIKVLRNFG